MDNKEKNLILDALTKLTTDFVPLKGEDYYNAICKYIVEHFKLDYSFVGKLNNQQNSVDILSGWTKEKAFDISTYDLSSTPCENIIAQNHVLYEKNVQKKFPKDKLLNRMKIESYAGIVLSNKDQEAIGVFVVMGKKPFKNPELIQKILKLYVRSISAEIQSYISEQLTNDLKNIAYYDPLTKLPNRLLLTDRIRRAVMNQRRANNMIAICLMDLDGFKEVNDTLGHDAGDFVLVKTSRRVEKIIRPEDTIARLGGDEFVIVLTDVQSPEDVARVLVRILNSVSRTYHYKDNKITSITASIGVTIYPEDRSDDDILLRHADQAMYNAKVNGKNQFYFFDLKEHHKVKANFKALKKIENAIINNEFELYFQPKLSVHNLKIETAEVLTRWNHPVLQLLSPSEFLPLIENDDIIFKFDNWVIKESFLTIKKLKENNINIVLSINISAKQFKQSNFFDKIKELADEADFNYSYFKNIEFEITENSALESVDHTNETISELKKLGITITLDDFGTGNSSLIHLKELNINSIKIDKSFVLDMMHDSQNMAIVNAIISLSKVFQIDVVAEGVENIEQMLMLFELGIDYIQGFYISRPMTYDQFINFLDKFEPDPKWKISPYNLPQRADFELMLAQSNHKYWVELIIDALTKKDYVNLPQLSHTSCRLGKWLQTKGKRYFSQLNSFSNLILIHKKIHNEVSMMVESLKKEQKDFSQEEIDKILNMKNELILVIEHLREEYRMGKISKGIDNGRY